MNSFARFSIIGAIVFGLLTLTGCNQQSREWTNPKTDKIQVETPQAYQQVTSPLVVTGQARGPWYFEASFPVRLLNDQGNELAVTPAQAQGDWMTEDFVPFTATLEFATTAKTGTLVFQKDNPSGLPEHDDELRMPVRFP
ncbi:MAG: Gmad2 immunoglobulin-like domain-containing protein [Candidatus Peregrinibacteria bacterium]